MVQLLWLVPALPLLGFGVLVFFGRRLGEPTAGVIATTMVGLSFVVSCLVFAGLLGRPEHAYEQSLFTWIPAGSFSVDVGFLLDPLSMTMLLFVTGVGALIHLYSIGYMHGDPRYSRFFAYLNLFAASMLVLILGDNLVLTFLGWEGVGACSYFLISFWFEKDANASAGKKAFVTNRVGDWGFMVAIFATFMAFGSVRYGEVLPAVGGVGQTTLTLIAVMLFIGAVGKSAQIPLYIWLPDAMAGPTPVSALIHAATMVTAGVYLMTRMNPVIAGSADWVPWLIAGIGAATAFLAATIALAQNDIKKVLAYSTVSQLGYMFLAVGSGAYVAAIFHMVTHAFFKALLFLGSGSVIHGMGDEQDMRLMGGLRKYMPITAATFIVGWLAIAGVFPLSGFWSKDDILTYALQKSPVLYAVGLITALLTAYYMSRQVFLVFYGEPRWGAHAAATTDEATADDAGEAVAADVTPAAAGHGDHGVDLTSPDFHPHESPSVMTIPLVVLAVLAAIGGVLNLPFGITNISDLLGRWLEPVVEHGQVALTYDNATVAALLGVSFAVALLGIFVAKVVYLDRRGRGAVEPKLFARGWYIDSSIAAFMGGPGRAVFDGLAWFDRTVIDGAVNGLGVAVRRAGQWGRRIESGFVRRYALGLALGSVVLLAFVASRVLAA